MLLHSLLMSVVLCCCSITGDHHDNGPNPMTMAAAHPPAQSYDNPTDPSSASRLEDQQLDAMWRSKVLELLTQLVLVQKEAAKHQGEVVQLLTVLGTQGSQQIRDLQNVARHQSLLVENHQALLLQTSRIATHLHDITKKPAVAVQ